MDKDKKEWEKKAKSAYAPPLIEAYGAAPGQLMRVSFRGWHEGADETYQDSDHSGGNNGGIEYGAKAVILGQEFSFNDVWEE